MASSRFCPADAVVPPLPQTTEDIEPEMGVRKSGLAPGPNFWSVLCGRRARLPQLPGADEAARRDEEPREHRHNQLADDWRDGAR